MFVLLMWVLCSIAFLLVIIVSKLSRILTELRIQNEEYEEYTDEGIDLSEDSESTESISYDEGELTEYERVRLLEEQEFDARIAALKREVQENVLRKGTPALSFHPDVKNLPHRVIGADNALPDVEYTE